MKKLILVVLAIIIIIAIILILTQREGVNDRGLDLGQEENGEEVGDREKGEDYLDMQGFHLYPPIGYNCEGGFVDGYRYKPATCVHEDRGNYEIFVNHGLVVSGIDPAKGLVDNQLVVRSFDFSGGQYGVMMCEDYNIGEINLNAEHYICFRETEGDPVITIGVGKSYTSESFGKWFEADIIVKEENKDLERDDYIDILVDFLNKSIKIDWEFKDVE